MKHEIVNDFNIDAVKDNFKVHSMGTTDEASVRELLDGLHIPFEIFFTYVYQNSEYYTDKGKKQFLVKDVYKIIQAKIDEYKDALIFCSGSDDFSLGGKAYIGFQKIKHLLN